MIIVRKPRSVGKRATMRAFAVLLLAAAASAAAPKSLPSTWPTCRKTNPKLGECIQNAVQVAVADLSEHGAKSFGVFPIEPLLISRIDIDQGHGPVAIDLHFTDLKIYGLSKAKVGLVKPDVEKIRFEAPLTIKEGITLKGHYKINGKVLILPITGDGPCELNLSNVTASVDIVGAELIKDGVRYAHVPGAVPFDFNTTRLKIKLENLFNGNKQLGDQMNVFLNENWAEILNELKPAVRRAFGTAFGDIANRILRRIPYEKIFSSEK